MISIRTQFIEKVRQLNINEAAIDDYSRHYLSNLINNIEYYLDIFDYVLEIALSKSGSHAHELTLVDYGCGNGLLGVYAKFKGFKNVILVDTDEIFTSCSERLARLMAVKVIIKTGDFKILDGVKFDVIVGTDVIEHVYDVQALLKFTKKQNPATVSVFTTASNPHNKRIVKRLRKLQVQDEIYGNENINLGPVHQSFVELRKNIILNRDPSLQPEEVDTLAKATRGMNYNDIVTAVQQYKHEGILPQPIDEYNTCNPLTGSWTERILTIDEYSVMYNSSGFHLDLYAGFYDTRKNGANGFFAKAANILMRVLGISFAPFIVLAGSEKN